MSKTHCFDSSKPISQFLDIKKEYEDVFIESHADRDEDDWAAANSDFDLGAAPAVTSTSFEVKRPPDGAGFLSSKFYTTGVLTTRGAGYETLSAISVYESEVGVAQSLYNSLGLPPETINNLNIVELETFLSLEPSDLGLALAPARTRSLAEITAAADARAANLQAFQDSVANILSFIPAECPSDLQATADGLYVEAFIDAFVDAKEKQDTAAISSTASIGSILGAGGGPSPVQIAKIKADAAAARATLAARLKNKISSDFIAEKRLIQEQCFVLSRINSLIDHKRKFYEDRLPYVEGTMLLSQQSAGVSSGTGATLETIEVPTKIANSPILIQGDPFAFMNKIIQYPTTHKLFDLTTAQISSLVPTIRFYKITTDPKTGEDIGEVEVTFDTNPAVKSYEEALDDGGFTMTTKRSALDLFKDKRKRGYGVGLKSFNFTFHGSDPFAVKKAIQAKLSIFATSFGDLIEQRGGYKYAELALKTGKTPEEFKKNISKYDQQNLDKLNFRLKAVVGWAIPATNVANFAPSEKDAVYDSFVTLNLTPTIHEFSFDETGGVNFVVNYLAYVEDYFNQSTFNVFSDPKIERTRIARKLFFEYLNTETCNENSLKVIKEASAAVMESEKSKSFSSILKKMQRYQKILNYNISHKDIDLFLKTGQIDNTKKLEPRNLNTASTKAILEIFKTFNESAKNNNTRNRVINLTKTTREQNILSFFFISDLLSVIMENIEETLEELTSSKAKGGINYLELLESSGFVFDSDEDASRVAGQINIDRKEYREYLKKEQILEYKKSLLRAREEFKKLRIILGPLEIVDPFDRKTRTFCSIGDIPLTLNYFTEFLTQKMISKQEVYYPLTNFVKDLIGEVVKNFLNNDSCFDFNIRQKMKLNSAVVTGHNEYSTGNTKDDITYMIKNKRTRRPLIKTSGPERSPLYSPDSAKEINYYIFYAGRAYPTEFLSGNEAVDSANGIFHYVLGKDRGIVKNITLDKTDMKGLKELRFEKEGFDGLTQLREVYNANIECFLNVQAYPGMYIYVDPRGFSPEAGINYSQFGIGGYYMITRAEHSIAPGVAGTKIVAKWVADTNGRMGDTSSENPSPTEDKKVTKPRKCLTKIRSNSFGASVNQNFQINSVFDLYKLTPLGAAVTVGQAMADTDN